MCGRYGFIPNKDFFDNYGITNLQIELKPNYNVAPGTKMPVVFRENNKNQIQLMKWGLIPHWAKDPTIGYKMINARSETINSKPSFKIPFLTKRCLIPVSGFYEWKKTTDSKLPYYIKLKKTPVFSFAGLYDIWFDAENKEIKTYTIITSTPNTSIINIHNRMPVILEKEKERIWLNLDYDNIPTLLSLLKPYSDEEMEIYPVSQAVNNIDNNFEDLVKPYQTSDYQLQFSKL